MAKHLARQTFSQHLARRVRSIVHGPDHSGNHSVISFVSLECSEASSMHK